MSETPAHYQAQTKTPAALFRELRGDEAYLAAIEFNILKYLFRYRHKGDPIGDLKKLIHYAEMAIEVLAEDQDP